MIGWTVKPTSRSGWRGIRSRLRFARTSVSETVYAEARHAASSSSSAPWPVSWRKTSSRVGLHDHEVVDRDARRVEPPDRLGDRAPSLAERHAHGRVLERRAPGRAAARAPRPPARPGTRRQADLQPLAAAAGLQLARRALGDHEPVVDDGDPVGEPVGLVQVLRRQQHGRPSRRRAPRSCPRARAGCADRGRWSARRGTARAAARRARRRGRADGASRRSRSARAGCRHPTRSNSASSSRARPRAVVAAAGGRAGRPSPGSRSRSGSRRPPRTGRRGRSARAAAPASRRTSTPATRAVPSSGASSVVRIRTAVVLPAPFGPSRPRTIPVSAARSTPSSATTLP